MPPPPVLHALQRRGDSPGRIFSIVFAIIAFLVVLGSLILVIVLPKFRKKPKQHPLSRYPIVPNYPHPFGPPPRFPSHPAVLRGFRKHPTRPPRQYDPRVESPFPTSPTQLDHIHRPLQDHSVHATTHSGGLFTPPPCSFSTRTQKQGFPHQKLRAAGYVQRPDPREYTAFSDKHDYILPVPEPVVLKPRPAGRPPPLTRQLERFPMPLSSSHKGGLMHPMKLFQVIEQRHSDTTLGSVGTPCPVAPNVKHPTARETTAMSAKVQGQPPSRPIKQESCKLIDRGTLLPEASPSLRKLEVQPTSVDAVERSKQPTTQKQERLERMGTLTRPKTPVAEIRDWFDRAASNATKEKSSSNRTYTPSSNPFATPGLSSTPPTSANKTPAPTTPSKPYGTASCMDVPSHGHRRTPSSVILPSPERLTAFPWATPSKKARQAIKGSPQARLFRKRSNTKRLKLVSWSKLRPSTRPSQRYSASSLSTIFKPILGTRSHHSQGASSVYSRDAKELSFLESIDRSGTGTSYKNEAESVYQMRVLSRNVSRLPRKQSASIDLLTTKINNWDLHTEDLDGSLLSSSAIKRSRSDTGPRRTTSPSLDAQEVKSDVQGKPVPVIQIGRTSDDVFGIEADGFQSHQASILMQRMARVENSPVILGRLGRGTAPGGGEWI